VTLLGGFEARLASGVPVRLPTKKGQALLAYLGIRLGQSHARDKLAALLWGDQSVDHARGGLRHALVVLRRALAGADSPIVIADGQTLALDPDRVDVDVASVERLVAEGSPEALAHAARLYRGDLLLGFSVSEPLFEDWLVAERERLRELVLDALARLLAHQTRSSTTERAIQTAVRLLGLDPLQEAVHRTLMQLYARQGRRGAALKQYQVCVGALHRELGTEPEAETRRLYQELLRRPATPPEIPDARNDGRSPPALAISPTPPDPPATHTPLFGRQADLGRLRQLLEEASRGRGHIATVVGEAGIGKTRLVGALAADAAAMGAAVLIGHCHESDSILPFGPWVDALRNGGLADDEEILGALHPARRAELARLLPEAGAAGLPPASLNALGLFESVTQLVEEVAARRPLLLVLEDLHWADKMSLRLLAFVSRRVSEQPVLLVVTAREEDLADAARARQTMEDLTRLARATSVALAPLSRADTALLVQALIRAGGVARPLAEVEPQIWAMSEGNPFVAVEALRACGHCTPGSDSPAYPGDLSLPVRVQSLISGRLGRLDPRAQHLAGVAAVIGRGCDFSLLQAASGMPELEAAEAVEEMVRHKVLHAVGNRLDFVRDRIRDVAYGRLLPPRRRLLHRAVIEAIEAAGAGPGLAPDRSIEHIDQLARHALRGELWEKAVLYLRQAANQAAARSALQDARIGLEQALGILGALPETPSRLEQAFEIRLELRPVLIQLGEVRRALEYLRQSEALAETLNDDLRRGRASDVATSVYAHLGELDAGLVTGVRALEVSRRLGDARLRIFATTHLAQVHYWRAEYERAVELATDNLAAQPAHGATEHLGSTAPQAVFARFLLMMSLAQLGRFAEAAPHETEAIRLAEVMRRDANAVGGAYGGASMLHLFKGDWAEAHTLIECWLAAARAGNVSLQVPYALAASAWALAKLGADGEAEKRLREGEEILALHAARGIVAACAQAYHALGRANLVLGRLDEAQRLADRVGETSPCHPGFAAWGWHLRGDIASHPDRLDAEQADAHYRQALGLAEPRGMRLLAAHCHLGLGQLYRNAGCDQARAHLDAAAAMYRDMEAPVWLAEALAN
jgi:DNA-binding SARP family transcriptional activator/tetratricopeptide (TPR) repeat protein